MPAAALFSRLHQAEFYRALHQEAADMLPGGGSQTWLDVGSGPGVLARMAAEKGYQVRAVDRDADMIAAAKNWPERQDNIAYAVSDLANELGLRKRYDVVSASSLLVVLPEPEQGLQLLRKLLKPGGQLLVIEASPVMSRSKAMGAFLSGEVGSGSLMLLLWAMARSGRALPDTLFTQQPGNWHKRPLLHGMANAWLSEPHKGRAVASA